MSRWLLALLFLLSFAFEFVYTSYSWAVAHNAFWLAVGCTALMPLLGLVEFAALIDAKGMKQRIVIGCITSAGFAAGTATVLVVVPR